MVEPEGLELEPLVAPISEEAPTGAPMRRDDGTIDPDYLAAKSSAQEARTAERVLARWNSAPDERIEKPNPPNWRQVEQATLRVLSTKSKDLWVTAWLIEALVRTRGFVGLRDGLRLTRELVERYWEQLHPFPGPDDDEAVLEYKLSQLGALNGTDADGVLIAPLRSVPLVESDEYGPLSLSDYLIASKIATIADPDQRQKKQEASRTAPLDDFEKAMLRSPASELSERLNVINEAAAELKNLDDALTSRCMEEDGTNYAPPTSSIRGVLEDCSRCIELYLKKVSPAAGEGQEDSESSAEDGGSEGGGQAGGTAGGKTGGKLQTREDAFRALLQVADYFRRAEPHSPVSYALEQAVRWGRMPLPELLRELISDQSVREDVYRRAGIPKPPDPSDE